MGDLDTETWIEATRSYAHLQRRYWRFFLGMPVALVVLGKPILAFDDGQHPVARGTLFALLFVVWFACWAGCAVTWFALLSFPCPQCGRRFCISIWWGWLSKRCKYCDLDLGGSAVLKAKPPAGVDAVLGT